MTLPVEPALRACYEACRRMHRRHDPTYYWATRRLPAALRPATHALYGYVRMADELVDGPSRPGAPEARRRALDAWEAQLDEPRHPIAIALADAGRRHRLPLGELHQYMGSMRIDCGRVRIGSWEELDAYSDGSAGTVGRIMAVLLGVPERRRADFGRLGQAFQLTNFLRDVREDRALDRVYLPASDLDDRAAVRRAVADGVGRARALFGASAPAVAEAPATVRPGVRAACAVYGGVLDRIEASGFDVLERRTTAPPLAIAGAALRALVA
jgi:15-cis-phytoene synthase